MVTPCQVRAARALLKWDQVMLADKAVVALTALQRFEQGKSVRDSTIQAIEKALIEAGIAFISRHNQEGVVLTRA
ncbi:transcriptional regulator [Microvirga sp. KLBC 81]|uniref:helix-turn-helix domain-containing protein n=1 Tax=Microvirga sp. KLBC 81 TaxID=1862707 RepID=UPI000D51AA5B|nr:helix-turn-helix transcriptional regulator [Microvirga sp. KLBC 81]PVE26085.1 transcriptional regulator [Microvirga sp. KLBC 81]